MYRLTQFVGQRCLAVPPLAPASYLLNDNWASQILFRMDLFPVCKIYVLRHVIKFVQQRMSRSYYSRSCFIPGSRCCFFFLTPCLSRQFLQWVENRTISEKLLYNTHHYLSDLLFFFFSMVFK